MTQSTCEERIDEVMAYTLDDVRKLWSAYCNAESEEDEYVEDLGSFHEYGLGFDYVPQYTFNDQPTPYFRWQLSWGGPSSEFRFYTDLNWNVKQIEFVFMDWWDGATRELTGDDFELLEEIFGWFEDVGAAQSEFDKAMEY